MSTRPRSRAARRRPVVGLALALTLAAALPAGGARAQSDPYPERPVRVVVPFVPGGAVDIVARALAQRAGEHLGQPIVIENRGGAGGGLGAQAVASSPADGYTVLMGTAGTHGTNPATVKTITYDPIRDFSPVWGLVTMPFILVANPALPAANVEELLALAKQRPGALKYASWGNGSTNHLAMELLLSLTDMKMIHVPYKGAGPAMVDVAGGQVDLTLDTFATSNPYIKSGRVKVLGIASPRRVSGHDDVKTLAESGVAGYTAGTWFGLFAPAGTPEPRRAKLHAAFSKALEHPEVIERLDAMGVVPALLTPRQMEVQVADEVARWKRVVKERGLTFE